MSDIAFIKREKRKFNICEGSLAVPNWPSGKGDLEVVGEVLRSEL
jgi:hypothetical protein